LILSRASLFTVIIAEIVMEETTRALRKRIILDDADAYLLKELDVFLQKMKVERVPHATDREFLHASDMIKHDNDVPALAAAIRAKPDWLVTDNIRRFNADVTRRTGIAIATPTQFLHRAGKIFPL
jgi:hypothetical protein